MFSACTTYEKQLRIEKTRLSHQVWSHGGSTFKKKRTLNGHFSRPAETDPYIIIIITIIKVRVGAMVDRKEGLISVPVVEHLLRACGLPTNGQLPFINSPQPNCMNVSRGEKSFLDFRCASNNASLNSEVLLCIILDFKKVS